MEQEVQSETMTEIDPQEEQSLKATDLLERFQFDSITIRLSSKEMQQKMAAYFFLTGSLESIEEEVSKLVEERLSVKIKNALNRIDGVAEDAEDKPAPRITTKVAAKKVAEVEEDLDHDLSDDDDPGEPDFESQYNQQQQQRSDNIPSSNGDAEAYLDATFAMEKKAAVPARAPKNAAVTQEFKRPRVSITATGAEEDKQSTPTWFG